jgi:hypothetical protein
MNAQDQALVAAFIAAGGVKVYPTRISLGSKQLRKGKNRKFLEA